MTKVQVTIEIPDEMEIAEPEMRCPKKDELFIDRHGIASQAIINFEREKYFILKKKWQWPTWLKAYCIAMDSDGRWWGYYQDVYPNASNFISNSPALILDPRLCDIELPTCADWTKSKIYNPNNKQ